MSTFTRLLAAAALTITIAGPAATQEPPGVPQRKPEAPAAKTDAFLNEQKERESILSDVVGMTVMTHTGKKVGEIDNLLLDDQNNIIGAVISVGGFLGLGGKKVALRSEYIRVQKGEEPKAVIDLTEDQLVGAPEFKTRADIRKEREQPRAPGAGSGTGGGAPSGGSLPPR